jgi:hypothetical protein
MNQTNKEVNQPIIDTVIIITNENTKSLTVFSMLKKLNQISFLIFENKIN